MKTPRTIAFLGIGLILALGPAGKAAPGQAPRTPGQAATQVIRCPEGTGTLAQRWEWARQTVRRQSPAAGYWVGYSIEKLMEENTYIGCFIGDGPKEVSLGELLDGGKTFYPSHRGNMSFFSGRGFFDRRADSDRMVKLVKKRIGVLYRFAKGAEGVLESVGAVDDHLPIAFEGKPLLWLGPATETESLKLLESLYDRPATGKLAGRIVETAGIHEESAPVVPFLERVIKSRAAEPVRVEAVSALSGYGDARITGILAPLAKSDASLEVRKEAIDVLGDIGKPEAIDVLIEIARTNGPEEVRKEAVQALGENPSEKTIAALERIIVNDTVPDVQEEAVDALAGIESGAGLPVLIRTAKTHPVIQIRKAAVEALGESSDQRALAALIELAKNKGTGL